jgi:hydroxyacylglutathione hydrolase
MNLPLKHLERVADDVWLLRGGLLRKTMNVYLIGRGGHITLFDAGIKAMTPAVAQAAAMLGRIDRLVLGHSHGDHRGGAPGLGVPVWCHEDEAADAESDGGEHYFRYHELRRWWSRRLMPWLISQWDGGPVTVAGTVKEGDEVAGFQVVHFPGHAPGLIGLWRASDRLALVSDTIYTLDPETGRFGDARLPHRAFNKDNRQARLSVLKLADLEPSAVWTGHADPVTGDVKAQLERAAANMR